MAVKPKIKETKPQGNNKTKDVVLWLLIMLGIAAGVVANFYYGSVAWSLRLAGWIVLAGILAAIALQTAQGKGFWEFAKASRAELRKVVWPTRHETIQTTAVVIGLVVLAALILWGVDSLLMWAISWLGG